MPEDENELSPPYKVNQGTRESSQGSNRDTVSRRTFVGTAALASAGFMSAAALAQSRQQTESGRQGNNASDPGPENKPLLAENPDSNKPPFTDTGNPGPTWYSFDITPKRLEAGGWTHQVTE